MYTGDNLTAQRYFTNAMNDAQSPQDRATYEILLAGSLEASDPSAAADHYLNVVNTGTLSSTTRGLAGVYLLMLLNVRHDAAFTQNVFARSPWSGLYRPLQPDDSINAEIAIAKAHEAIITSYPNFLSYLIAGEFYARKYPYLAGAVARFKQEYGDKATTYFDKGVASLRDARDTGEWDKTRLAIGYTYMMTYAVELQGDKLRTLDPQHLRALYLEAAGFAEDESRGERFMDSAQFSIRLSYAQYLSSQGKEADQRFVDQVAGELAALAAKPANRALIIQIMAATDPTSKYGRYKSPLLFMASSSPALEQALTDAVAAHQTI